MKDVLSNRRSRYRLSRVGKHDRKFVTTDSCYHIRLPHACFESVGNADQKLVAARVPEAVVDDFETIQVEIQDDETFASAVGMSDQTAKRVVKGAPIGEAS